MFQLMTCSVRVHLTCLTQAPRDTVPHLMGALAGTEAASVVATCNNPPRASDSLFTHAPLQASSTSQVLPAPSYIAIVQYHRMSYTMSLAPLIRCANVAWAMHPTGRETCNSQRLAIDSSALLLQVKVTEGAAFSGTSCLGALYEPSNKSAVVSRAPSSNEDQN